MTAEQYEFGYLDQNDCSIAQFSNLVERQLTSKDAPFAATVEKSVPIYDGPSVAEVLGQDHRRLELMSEWAAMLSRGPGLIVVRQAYSNGSVLDAATSAYSAIIKSERQTSHGGGDHFAAAGSNDRIWNSLGKLCSHDPELFARYFGNPVIAAICEAWLGPGYQMTAQVNVVHPGGKAQEFHCDYHLGFQTTAGAARYPAHVHRMSPFLTLQGAIAHDHTPIESGPTKLLPFSQLHSHQYLASDLEVFRDYFEGAYIQLPLEKGDCLFFNPSLFHAAGANSSADIHRMVNLLQVSSPFGRAMESVDRLEMCKRVYPAIVDLTARQELTEAEVKAAVAACAEGYSFPTNLDRDPPIDGLAPETQFEAFLRALDEGMTREDFAALLDQQAARQNP